MARARGAFEAGLGRRLVGKALARVKARAEEGARARGAEERERWAVREAGARLAGEAARVIERRRIVVAFASAAEALRNSDALDVWRDEVEGRGAALDRARAIVVGRLARARVEKGAARWAAGARERTPERARRRQRSRRRRPRRLSRRGSTTATTKRRTTSSTGRTPRRRAMVRRRTHPHRPARALRRTPQPATAARSAAPSAAAAAAAASSNTPTASARGRPPRARCSPPATTRQRAPLPEHLPQRAPRARGRRRRAPPPPPPSRSSRPRSSACRIGPPCLTERDAVGAGAPAVVCAAAQGGGVCGPRGCGWEAERWRGGEVSGCLERLFPREYSWAFRRESWWLDTPDIREFRKREWIELGLFHAL